MTASDITRLVDEFADSVIKHQEAILAGDGKATKKQGERTIRIWRKIKNLGEEAKEQMTMLFKHPDQLVRVAAAGALLNYKHQEAMTVLKEEVKAGGFAGFCAEQQIAGWEKGTWALE